MSPFNLKITAFHKTHTYLLLLFFRLYFLQMRSHLAQAVSLRKRVTRLTLQFGRKKMSFGGRGKVEICQVSK